MAVEDLEVYQLSIELGEEIWDVVTGWDQFSRDTVGKQFVRAVDSVTANIAEACGRYHYGERRQFLFYARGSLIEAESWLKKASLRDLICRDHADRLASSIGVLARRLNAFIRSLNRKAADG